jgi:hypothetical protein
MARTEYKPEEILTIAKEMGKTATNRASEIRRHGVSGNVCERFKLDKGKVLAVTLSFDNKGLGVAEYEVLTQK